MNAPLKKDEAALLAAKGYHNPAFFCRYFLEHWFSSPMPWLHLGMLAVLTRRCDFLLDEDTYDGFICAQPKEYVLAQLASNFVYGEEGEEVSIFTYDGEDLTMHLSKFTLMMIPRGFSKTTIVNACTLMEIYYQEHKFPVYVSEAGPHAKMQLGNVKREIETNLLFRAVFGIIHPERMDPEKWSEDFIETTTGIAVGAKGRGSQIRGLNHNGQRPDWIVVDDVEDKESVKTADQREKTKIWAYGDLIPALPRLDDNATITALGTLLDAEALLITWSRDPNWTTIRIGAVDNESAPVWPENMDLAGIDAEKKSYQLAGQLHVFYMEFFNKIRAEEDAKFRPEYIIYEPAVYLGPMLKALVIDPAISEDPGAAYSALVVVGINEKGLIAVLDARGNVGMDPREQVDLYFELYNLYKPEKCGVEAIAYQAALVHLLREEMFRKNAYFEIETITHSSKTKKEERILGILQPRYAAGYVRHVRRFPELETQLLDFPNGKKDFPDAMAMAVALLDPFAAQAADPEKDLAEDEYEDLEEVFDGEWRSYA